MPATEHRIDIYDAVLHIARTPLEWEEMREQYPRDLPEIDSIGLAQVFTSDPPGNQAHLAIFIDTTLDLADLDLINIIAHEADHAADCLFEQIGEKAHEGPSEASAYLVGWIAEKLWGDCHE